MNLRSWVSACYFMGYALFLGREMLLFKWGEIPDIFIQTKYADQKNLFFSKSCLGRQIYFTSKSGTCMCTARYRYNHKKKYIEKKYLLLCNFISVVVLQELFWLLTKAFWKSDKSTARGFSCAGKLPAANEDVKWRCVMWNDCALKPPVDTEGAHWGLLCMKWLPQLHVKVHTQGAASRVWIHTVACKFTPYLLCISKPIVKALHSFCWHKPERIDEPYTLPWRQTHLG